MRLAIVATPPLALVAILTAGIALRPHATPTAAPPVVESSGLIVCPLQPPVSCHEAHKLLVTGFVSGGASHVRLAGPVIYTDVTTDAFGKIGLTIPVDGDVCALLRAPKSYSFSDGSMQVSYTIGFER